MTTMSDNADFASFTEVFDPAEKEEVPADLPEEFSRVSPISTSAPEGLAALSFSLWLI